MSRRSGCSARSGSALTRRRGRCCTAIEWRWCAPAANAWEGHVEVDEAYLGGMEGKVHGRETQIKAIVAIAVEIENPKGFGRIRLGHIADVTADSLLPFIDAAVEPGASVHTDGWQAYWNLRDHGYEHERTIMRQHSDPAHVVMPSVHRVASLLQRWMLGTHQGSIGAAHLQSYLNEYTFRFNRRHPRRRGMLFYRLLQQAVIAEPVPYRSLVANRPQPAADRRSRPDPVESPPSSPLTVPGAKPPITTGLPDSNR